MIITRTQYQLDIAHDNDLSCYATPTSSGSLGGYYWASRASWQDDVCVATVHDFDTWSYEGDDDDQEHSCSVVDRIDQLAVVE